MQKTAAIYIDRHNRKGHPVARAWVPAYAEGLKRHGYSVEEHTSPRLGEAIPNASVHVCWSFKHPPLVDHCRTLERPLVVLEHGFTPDRRIHGDVTPENQLRCVTSVNLGDLNGRSQIDASLYQDDDSRCKKYGWFLQPRASDHGNDIAVMGQLSGDMSMIDLPEKKIYGWAQAKIAEIKASQPSRKIWFKPHPLEPENLIPRDQIINAGASFFTGDMKDVFKMAERVVTYSSTAGVDAWLKGVPATADCSISMIHAYQERVGIDADPNLPALKQWLNELSFKQFWLDEMRQGLAWDVHGTQVVNWQPRRDVAALHLPSLAEDHLAKS